MSGLPEDAQRNRDAWTKSNADYTDARARHDWSQEEITWGVFGVPEVSLGTLGDVDGLDVVELGCGTAYVSAWLARRGARPVGVDVTPAQLATARRCQWPGEIGVEWHLPHGELFRLLRRTGFDVVDLVELYAPEHARDHEYYAAFSAEWARSWPAEELWVAVKSR